MRLNYLRRCLAVALGVGGSYWMVAAAPPIESGETLPTPKKPAVAATPQKPSAQAPKVAPAPVVPTEPAAAAKFYLASMKQALGGEEKLKALKSLRLEWVGVTNLLEQAERPEGPYIKRFTQATEDRDLVGKRFRVALQNRSFFDQKWSDAVLIGSATALVAVAGDNQAPAPVSFFQDYTELQMFSPEALAATAESATDLRAEAETTVFHGVAAVTLSFKAKGMPVRLLLAKETNVPLAVEWTTTRSSDMYWYLWGDLRTRLTFAVWSLDAGGILYPRQWEIERNKLPWMTVSITNVTFNPELEASSLVVDATMTKIYETVVATRDLDTLELGLPNSPAMWIKPTLAYVPGRMGVTLLHQDDGVVVIDAPVSNGYTRKVIDEAGWRFRGKPIKAVISTSDSWAANGGLREFVAASVPVYALQANKAFVEQALASPHTLRPDRLALQPKQSMLTYVSSRTTLGSGPNRIELIPARGTSSERQLLVYFPEYKLLYTGDLVNQLPDKSYYMPAYLGEVVSAVQREHLDVVDVFGSHLQATPYSDVVQFYRRVFGAK